MRHFEGVTVLEGNGVARCGGYNISGAGAAFDTMINQLRESQQGLKLLVYSCGNTDGVQGRHKECQK